VVVSTSDQKLQFGQGLIGNIRLIFAGTPWILEGQEYPRLWWELIENGYTALVDSWLADTSN